jgi:hypothetical protein
MKGRAFANPAFHLSTKKMILSDLVHIPIVFIITWSELLSFPLLELLKQWDETQSRQMECTVGLPSYDLFLD